MIKRRFLPFIILIILFSACNQPSVNSDDPATSESIDVEPTSLSSTPTVVVEPIETLTICTASLPVSFFPYDDEQSRIKEEILAIIQDGPFEQGDDGLEPVILGKVPAQADGDLRLEPVTVQTGQVIVSANGEIAVLASGVTVRPSGCRQSDCAVTWGGEGTLEVDRMVIEYQLRDDLLWSDGTRLTAQDSVFSYELAGAPEASGLKWEEERTDTYTALDDTTVQWIGLPGFTTAEPERFFWAPLPSHLFAETESWEEIAADGMLVSSPLSFGPFILVSRDEHVITFERNPLYFRSDEGLPVLNKIFFRAVDGGADEAWALLKSGDCDVLDSSFKFEGHPELLAEIMADEQYEALILSGDDWSQLVFGIKPVTYDGSFNLEQGDRPDFFGDVRTRQAIAMCLDRSAMINLTTQGLGTLWSSFLSPSQSQLDENDLLSYDPELSAQLLHQVGWRDHDENPETPLQAWEVANVPVGTEFIIEFAITQSAFHQDLAQVISSSLQAVGIQVNVTSYPVEELYAPGPDGLLFGRQFELTLISWQSSPGLDCSLYQSWQIPLDDNLWIGTNIAGLADEVYDNQCSDASLALTDEYGEEVCQSELSFLSALPAVPLFSIPGIMTFSGTSCYESKILTEGDFYNLLEYYEINATCP